MANELERSKRIVFNKQFEDEINPENLKLFIRYKMDMQMRGLSEKSIYGYERDIMQWFSYLNKHQFNNLAANLTEDDIEEFIYYCKQQGNHENRIRRRIAPISMFYKYLRKKKIIIENPMEFISRPKKGLPIVVQTFLTKEQVNLMKEKLKELGDLQLYTYALLSLSTMARVNAVSNITWNQIDFDNRTIDDVLEKEGKIVTLYFSKEVKELLLKLKNQRETDGIECKYVFLSNYGKQFDKVEVSTLSNWTKKIGEMINVPTLHPHDFRHTNATLLKNSGMPLEDISELLNHSGTDVTRKHYIKQDKTKIGKEKDKYEF